MMILKKPKIRSHLRLDVIQQEGVSLLSEREAVLFDDELYQQVMPFIDGHRTVDDIVVALEGQVPETYVYYAIMTLAQSGYLVEHEDVFPEPLAVFCEHLGVNLQDAAQRLQNVSISVEVLGDLSGTDFITALAALHIQVVKDGRLQVVITDDYLRWELDAINRENLARSRPWMLLNPLGTRLWLGPIFKAKETACWACLSHRWRDNQPVQRFLERHGSTAAVLQPPLAALPTTRQTALNMAATEIFKWIVQGGDPRLEGHLITVDTLTLQTQTHAVAKRPQCQSCGILSGARQRPLPVVIGHRKKVFTADGGHRCATPEETLQRYQHLISSITGVVRELTPLASASKRLTSTYAAPHHFASVFDDFRALQQNLGARSAGKGRSDAQARASGFCEAIERYSGVFQGDEIRFTDHYQNLGDRAIHPNACMNFSPAQYETRTAWNAHCHSIFQRVPAPFDERREIEWTPLWSLTYQDFRYLPTAYCYFGYPARSEPDCWADTNGCAAGNTLEEAILQGFMELVERDSIALWWYNRVPRPRVDLDSFDEPYFQELIDIYQSLHRDLWVLDLKSDLNIPAFAALSRRCDRDVEDILLGFGAHFDPRLAIQRALTEVNQLLPAVSQVRVDGATQYPASAEPPVVHWWQTATVDNQPYLAPTANCLPRVAADYDVIQHDDLLDDIKWCQALVEQRGMEMLVLDQTRPDIGLRVAKVVVPGMRHFWKRLGPGRLYDVPVQLGWLNAPFTEAEMNPIPMYL